MLIERAFAVKGALSSGNDILPLVSMPELGAGTAPTHPVMQRANSRTEAVAIAASLAEWVFGSPLLV